MQNNRLNSNRIIDYLTLCKPKVILMMLVTSWVGMHLATHAAVPLDIFIFATLGIALTGGSAAVINHIVDRHIDAKMTRTVNRPLVTKRISVPNACIFSAILGISGFWVLANYTNPLTTSLTFGTVLGYGLLYTFFLKRYTPQNIVIGGLAGAMPPLLGWTAVTGQTSAFAWILVLIIFTWTPPHFWSLAIHRKNDYENAHIPMLPNTHGILFTKLNIVLYTILLFVVTLLPYAAHMAGCLYFGAASLLGAIFLAQTVILYRTDSNRAALKTFSFSILYLLLLFGALLIDHYVTF